MDRVYYCRNHDPLRAGGEHRRCPERNIRADELDAFVFDQVRVTMLRPDVLLTGETAISMRQEAGGDELLATQVARLDRKIDTVAAERRRLADLYQADFIERTELLRRGIVRDDGPVQPVVTSRIASRMMSVTRAGAVTRGA